jgi:hypothetical protein
VKEVETARTKRFEVCLLAGQVMTSIFWYAKGVINIEIMPLGKQQECLL